VNSSLDNVYELLRLGYGDEYRLGNLKKRLESGAILYASDNDYLQKLVNQYSGEIQKVVEHKKPEPQNASDETVEELDETVEELDETVEELDETIEELEKKIRKAYRWEI
jgi:predicted RNase H-like nuclease (RuvC/YqgF family)